MHSLWHSMAKQLLKLLPMGAGSLGKILEDQLPVSTECYGKIRVQGQQNGLTTRPTL